MVPDSEKFITEAVEKYSDTVFRVAFQYTGNRCDAEDIVQDVFVKLLDKRPPLVGEPLKAWLIRVTINRSKDVLRALARRRKAPLGYALPAPQPESTMISASKSAATRQAPFRNEIFFRIE